MLSAKVKDAIHSPETFISTADAPLAAETTIPAARRRVRSFFMMHILDV